MIKTDFFFFLPLKKKFTPNPGPIISFLNCGTGFHFGIDNLWNLAVVNLSSWMSQEFGNCEFVGPRIIKAAL